MQIFLAKRCLAGTDVVVAAIEWASVLVVMALLCVKCVHA